VLVSQYLHLKFKYLHTAHTQDLAGKKKPPASDIAPADAGACTLQGQAPHQVKQMYQCGPFLQPQKPACAQLQWLLTVENSIAKYPHACSGANTPSQGCVIMSQQQVRTPNRSLKKAAVTFVQHNGRQTCAPWPAHGQRCVSVQTLNQSFHSASHMYNDKGMQPRLAPHLEPQIKT